MTEKDPKDSVQNEQFGSTENTNDETFDSSTKAQENKALSDHEQSAESESESETTEETPEETPEETVVPITESGENTSEGKEVTAPEAETGSDATASVAEEGDKVTEETKVVAQSDEEITENNTDSASIPSSEPVEQPTKKVGESNENKVQDHLPSLAEIDFSKLTKEELVDRLKLYISEFPIEQIKDHVETIRSVFYKKHNEEIADIHKKFIDEGGTEEDFKVEDSPVEIAIKDLINLYRQKRDELSKSQEELKDVNLNAKYEIIEAIKELINSQESLNQTFQDFRNLQDRWREIGPVPQKNVKDLWENYHYHVEAFYDYIKINKELRDLDFKKNLDAKLTLCEKAEELLIEPSVVEAFRKLQVLHDQWREIGPVPADKRNELWERFRDATSKINHRHQEYFVNLKDEQKNNLQEKTALCEKAEEIAAVEIDNAKLWEEKSRDLIELQKVWKTIGFAPKKHNTKIYERFRAACDKFFNQKREFFASNREEQENNLQLKTELCIQAEALQDNTDWKKTTNDLIKLQKRWKAIGPVPMKSSDKIWKRFRAACDTFFNNKSKFFENIDSRYEDNLKHKNELIEQIKNFELSTNIEENLKKLKEFQREWSEIGFVPIKLKDEIQEKYREAINQKFDQLKVDDSKKSVLKFRSRIESIASKPNSEKRLSMERDKCYNRLKQLENDITLWENNIGFFANSKNAESMISDVEQKIESAKQKIEDLNEKINIIDDYD
ncbi:MAG: DUF349 domain-containing protein [Bacteroidales bacterium]|nr:DUF349 domain-containing protein [Bacteroidales bacterium]MBN2818823.1 DUF349 domain-containing protein [Bacteroidales bacterium]